MSRNHFPFFAFVKKEFFHIVRDSRTMLILLGMPIVQILLFGFAINVEVKNVRTAVYNPSPDEFSRRIVERISHNPYFSMAQPVHSVNEAEKLLRQSKIDLILVFPASFENNATHSRKAQIQLITDTSNPNIGTISENYASAIIARYQQEIAGRQTLPYQIGAETRMLFNPAMQSAFMFVPGIMGLVLMIICAMMTSVSIVREKERGTMEVLLASPLKLPSVLLAKATPYLGLSFINLVSILLISYFVLHVPIQSSLALLLSLS
ncbi:MAG: ABC transporter permease, partial [Dysgonamonadaceae bacterium]|nr:ABC transporter permease [Dysgonamonadaceae bacterium]